MHQTFYIGPDEEIISVISKIKESSLAENILVIPPGALILQSIVNLRLLKKEAEKMGKQIMIVTQDERSRSLIEKAGILAQPSLDEADKKANISESEKSVNVAEIGTKDFFNENALADKNTEEQPENRREELTEEKKTDLNYNKPSEEKKDFQKNADFKSVSAQKAEEGKFQIENSVAPNQPLPVSRPQFSESKGDTSDILVKKKENGYSQPLNTYEQNTGKNFDSHKEKEIEKLFGAEIEKNSEEGDLHKENKEEEEPGLVSGKIKKLSLTFLTVCFLVILALGFYLIFPKASVDALIKTDQKKNNLVVEGDKNALAYDAEKKIIPAIMVEKEDSLSLSFEATGKGESSDQKARGLITVYNEYGKNSQPLVATTRFLTPEGKLFRLVKGVTVPGITEVDGKTEPGAIEAEVVADGSGKEYNIGPSDFSIPGFEGSPKYDKFYARSSDSMMGGGSEESGIVVVSQEDIDSAKKKLESTLENKIKESIKNEAGSDKVILDDAVERNVSESGSSVEKGVATKSFDYQAKMKIKAIVFSQEDLLKIMESDFKDKREKGGLVSNMEKEGVAMKISGLEIEYGNAEADFEEGKIIIKAAGIATLEPVIDADNLKKELLGKNDLEVKEILGKYPQVDKVEIEYWPKFFSREIPRFEKRVELKTGLIYDEL